MHVNDGRRDLFLSGRWLEIQVWV